MFTFYYIKNMIKNSKIQKQNSFFFLCLVILCVCLVFLLGDCCIRAILSWCPLTYPIYMVFIFFNFSSIYLCIKLYGYSGFDYKELIFWAQCLYINTNFVRLVGTHFWWRSHLVAWLPDNWRELRQCCYRSSIVNLTRQLACYCWMFWYEMFKDELFSQQTNWNF